VSDFERLAQTLLTCYIAVVTLGLLQTLPDGMINPQIGGIPVDWVHLERILDRIFLFFFHGSPTRVT